MYKYFLLLALSFYLIPSISADTTQIFESYGKIPLAFTVNQGQTDSRVKFTTSGNGCNMFFTQSRTVYVLSKETEESVSKRAASKTAGTPEDREPGKDTEREYESFAIQTEFVGANTNADVIGEDRLPWNNNYFIGSDQSKWHTDVPNYSKVRLLDIYSGVDLVYYGNRNRMKYDFVVKSGEDASKIAVKYDLGENAGNKLSVNAKGQLAVNTPLGEVIEEKPYCFQKINGKEIPIDISYKIIDAGNNIFGFGIGNYDRRVDLIIDPELIYSTFLGGSGNDEGASIALDSSGCVYVTGYTESSAYPTTSGAYDSSQNSGRDVFVTKLNADGKGLVYSTFIGGTYEDEGYGIAVDSYGNAYVTGYTYSSLGYPLTTGAFTDSQSFGQGIQVVFISKLNSTGNNLIYSANFGGNQGSYGRGIFVDGSGNTYITGKTSSSNFPVTNGAYSTNFNGYSDAFVTKLNADGTGLVYSTYLGGGDYDTGRGIKIDTSGNAFIIGRTQSSNFPITSGAYDASLNSYGGGGLFVTKLNMDGTKLVYSTFLDGDYPYGIAIDNSGCAYATGCAAYSLPVTSGAYDTSFGGNYDAFVTKFNASGSDLVYSTFIGGNNYEYPYGIALDSSGNAYITGSTNSSDYPVTSNAYDQSFNGSNDAFLAKLNTTGTALIYSTFLGGGSNDYGYGIAVDSSGLTYVTGGAGISGFPTTTSAYDISFNGGTSDTFVTKFNLYTQEVNLTSPNGGETWVGGMTYNITWVSANVNSVKIEYSTNSGTSWTTIVSSTPASAGTYAWTVPLTTSTSCKIRLSDSSSISSITDTSNAVFAIASGYTVQGNAYLSDITNHSGIKVLFERTAPSVLRDSVYTDSSGHFSKALASGLYNLTYSKDSYFTKSLASQSVYSTVTFSNITLSKHKTRILVPADFSTIQSAINASSSADTVLVSPGKYIENINFNGKNIVLGSLFLTTQDTTYISSTIIDGNQNGHVVEFSSGEDSTAVLCGFTITNGYASGSQQSGNGGGIYCTQASPQLENLNIAKNQAQYSGGGVSISDGYYSLMKNININNNTSGSSGGGISLMGYSTPKLININIINNTSFTGGGVYSSCYSISMVNVNIVLNTGSDANQGGAYTIDGYGSNSTIKNSNIYNNIGNRGIYCISGLPNISNSNFWNNQNGNFYNCGSVLGKKITVNANGDSCDAYNNIFLDPKFVDAAKGDYRLSDTSPCIGAGTADGAPLTDIVGFPRGNPPDIGAYENALTRLPLLRLFTPNGGESLTALKTTDITWDYSGVTRIKIEYSTNNGSSWTSIAEGVDVTDGKYPWSVPETLSGQCRIRITDMDNSARTDTSDNVFTISAAPYVKVISPNGGEYWKKGSTQNITWQSSKIENIKLEYSLDSGEIWTTLADSVQCTAGTYAWVLPDQIVSTCMIRLTDISDPRFSDTSDRKFSLIDKVFSIDSDLITPGCQDSNYVSGIGGGKYIAFAIYSHGWENVKEFAVSFTWDPSKVQYSKTYAALSIPDQEFTMNNSTFTPTFEQNVFGGSIFEFGEIYQSQNGYYTKSFINTGGVTSTDGLVYFAMFKTTASFTAYDSLSIKAGVTVKDPQGNSKVLDSKYFFVLNKEKVIEPPSNFTVSDYPSDNGHQLQLRWSASPSESDGLVSCYKIYRSRNSTLTEPIPITNLSSWNSIKYYEEFYTILVDSVAAGTTEYVDFVPLNNTAYYYWLQAVGDTGGASKMAVPGMVTTVESAPVEFSLSSAYPNPFNPTTTIDFAIPADTKVVMKIYNIAGQEVATLKDEMMSAGVHTVVWNAKDMPSGIYFYRLKAGVSMETKKMTLLK